MKKGNLPVAGVLHHVDNLFLGVAKSLIKTLEYGIFVWVFLGEIVVWKVLLHLVLNVEWQSVFE